MEAQLRYNKVKSCTRCLLVVKHCLLYSYLGWTFLIISAANKAISDNDALCGSDGKKCPSSFGFDEAQKNNKNLRIISFGMCFLIVAMVVISCYIYCFSRKCPPGEKLRNYLKGELGIYVTFIVLDLAILLVATDLIAF